MGNWNQSGNRGWNQSGGGYDDQYHGGGGPSNFNGRGYSNQRGYGNQNQQPNSRYYDHQNQNFTDQSNMGSNQQSNVPNQGTGGNRGQYVSNYSQTIRPPDALLKLREEDQRRHEEELKRTNAHMKMLETQIAQLASNSSPSSSSSTIPKNVGERSNEPLSVEKEEDVKVPKKKEAIPLPLNRQPREEKLPFPQRFVRAKLDAQYGKFLDVIKNLHVCLPFIDAMKQIPHYSKFLKELLSGRRECETVSLTANCSAILSNKLPTKLNDPGSFSIPCSINGVEFDKALCYLGASVSPMTYSFYQKLSIGTLSPTNVTLQLADRSTKFPMGKIEDISRGLLCARDG
ncbi:ATP-dependent RNA helicase bel-like [Chenopodium quinoa]|uniref:ATP-dependent RNA helicase bel-like n=1 Tax=Chenopodium quinoa TaxID=63459 RepID=UPI000B76F935|nr:ATP-dependent RNA helicase bel-like [Chenopodium quinoa]